MDSRRLLAFSIFTLSIVLIPFFIFGWPTLYYYNTSEKTATTRTNRFNGCVEMLVINTWEVFNQPEYCYSKAQIEEEKARVEKSVKAEEKQKALYDEAKSRILELLEGNATQGNSFYVNTYNGSPCLISWVEITIESGDKSRKYVKTENIPSKTTNSLLFDIFYDSNIKNGKFIWYFSDVNFSDYSGTNEISCVSRI